jgi:carbonic anhydrase
VPNRYKTPEAALEALKDGNARFAADHMTIFRQDTQMLRQHTLEIQEPFAAILACADSRVPVELIFDQHIGQLFVNRVAGNMVTPEMQASLEYGAAVLGVRLILVLGHARCGAVKATVEGGEVPGEIGVLLSHIQPAVAAAGKDYEAVSKANAQIQAAKLLEASPLLRKLVAEGSLNVVAGYYDLASGVVSFLN